MPHDVNGVPLKVGDEIILRATIKDIHAGEEYCNANIQPLHPMPPYTVETTFSIGGINTRQLEKVSR